ncbi:hypothetical protein C8R44DRAFT_799282 [Mycena epipterygia]|nr:hypothetical protein C8R44DRAFT_799282 [Mycena epipterygia]
MQPSTTDIFPLWTAPPTTPTTASNQNPVQPSHLDPTYLELRPAAVRPATTSISISIPSSAAIPPVPQFVFDQFEQDLDHEEQGLIASHETDNILRDLLSFALQVAWIAGWKQGQEGGLLLGKQDGRREGIAEGCKLGADELKARSPSAPPTVREFTDTKIQTDAAAFIRQTPSPFIVAENPFPPSATPAPRDFTSLQTGSSHPFGTLQRRLARSRRPLRHAQKNLVQPSTHPIVTRRHPRGISHNKPVTTTPIPSSSRQYVPSRRRVLDWDGDPLLSELGRALGALGWIRGG